MLRRLLPIALLLATLVADAGPIIQTGPRIFVEPPEPPQLTGIEFPSGVGTQSNANSHRFKFTGADLVPIYGAGNDGVTYLFKVQPIQQTGYYTTFFWGNDDGNGNIGTFTWNGGAADSYYGAHPYPPAGSGGTTHKWEISVETLDPTSSADVVKDVWYSQALTVDGEIGAVKVHTYYWNLPDVSGDEVVTHTTAASDYGDDAPPSPALTFGDAPWQPALERCSCILRGIQIYDELLNTTQINALEALETDADVLAEAANLGLDDDLWYLNMNPTPDDISDKSGASHDPAWLNANHGTLWEQ